MNEPPFVPNSGDVTEPIPVVAVEPPPLPSVSPVRAPAVPPQQPPVIVTSRYIHRFGSVPFYLFARFAAFLIDTFVVTFVIATFIFAAFDAGLLTLAGHDETGFDSLALAAIAAALLFAFLCEAIFGTTLGKLVFALHTRRGDGRHAGALRVFIRYLFRPLDLLLVGPLLALVTPRHQRIGDFASGTVVGQSRIGGFAALIGIGLLVGVGYVQTVFGGGITSAIGVGAETASYAPGLIARAANAFAALTHTSAPHSLVQPSDAPTALPRPQPSDGAGVQ